MTHHNWKPVVKLLKVRTGKVTRDQILLAKTLGVKLDQSLPALVAAQQLRSLLEAELLIRPPGEVTEPQLEFLRDLEEQLERVAVVEPASRAEASAWIEVLDTERAIRALKGLRLSAGDVVSRSLTDDEPGEIVASITDDGTVYFKGGGGKRSRPHKLRMLVRHGDNSEGANRLRFTAEERIAASKSRAQSVSSADIVHLAPFKVTESAGRPEGTLVQNTLDGATDERPLQSLFTKEPSILASLVRGTRGVFVRPLPRLGGEYVPDFAVAHIDSIGIHWTLVELESPAARLATSSGEPAAKLRTAVQQVNDWRDWLGDNLGYARNRLSENGLGLTGITSRPSAVVLIGTAQETPQRFENQRRRYRQESDIIVHTYSWLVEVLNTWHHPILSPLGEAL